MVESMKQKALGVAAANALEFAPQFHGKWYEGYKLLLECHQSGQEPEHCSFREGMDFWSWDEAIRTIELEAESIWKPIVEELNQQKASLLKQALEDEGSYGLVTVENLQGLSTEAKHEVLIESLKKTVQHLNDELEGERDLYRVSAYSGRGMYGRQCVAVTTPVGADMSEVSMIMGDLYREFGQPRRDSMGLGSVFYWPAIKYEGIEEDEAA